MSGTCMSGTCMSGNYMSGGDVRRFGHFVIPAKAGMTFMWWPNV